MTLVVQSELIVSGQLVIAVLNGCLHDLEAAKGTKISAAGASFCDRATGARSAWLGRYNVGSPIRGGFCTVDTGLKTFEREVGCLTSDWDGLVPQASHLATKESELLQRLKVV